MKTTILLLLLISSCSSMKDVNNSANFKDAICVSAPEKDVYAWVKSFMKKHEFGIVDQDDEKMFIAGKQGVSAFSWGEYLGVQVMKAQNSTRISYKSAKKSKMNITAKNWDSELKEQIEKKYEKTIVQCPEV